MGGSHGKDSFGDMITDGQSVTERILVYIKDLEADQEQDGATTCSDM